MLQATPRITFRSSGAEKLYEPDNYKHSVPPGLVG